MTDTFVILERINALYAASFSQLITYTVGVVAFVGLLVPLMVTLFQRRQAAEDKAHFQRQINEELGVAKQELVKLVEHARQAIESQISIDLAKSALEAKATLLRQENYSRAGLAHVQGTLFSTINHHAIALIHFARSVPFSVSAQEEENMRSALRMINTCASKIIIPDIPVGDRTPMAAQIRDALTAVASINERNRWGKEIADLQRIEEQLLA